MPLEIIKSMEFQYSMISNPRTRPAPFFLPICIAPNTSNSRQLLRSAGPNILNILVFKILILWEWCTISNQPCISRHQPDLSAHVIPELSFFSLQSICIRNSSPCLNGDDRLTLEDIACIPSLASIAHCWKSPIHLVDTRDDVFLRHGQVYTCDLVNDGESSLEL
jgi:hypothetical protein